MKTLNSILIGLVTLCLVTACGGGGTTGIVGNAGLGTTVTGGVSITAANAPNVAAAVLYGVNGVSGSSAGAASAPPLVTGVAVNATSGNFSLSGLVLDQLARIPAQQSGTGNGIVGAVVSNNVNCAISGSAALNLNLATPTVLTEGDTLGVRFILCNEIGILMDGRLDLTVTDIQNSITFDGIPPFNITLDVLLTALRALDGSEYYYADGDLQQVLVDDGAGNINGVISGASLDTSYNGQYPLDTAYHDQRLTAYLFDISTDENTGDYIIDLDGTVESRDIDGTVTFTTTDVALGGMAFTGNEFVGNGDPTAGTLVIISSEPVRTAPNPSGSRMRLIAQANGVDVELQVDADNDGIYETTGIMTTWAALAQL